MKLMPKKGGHGHITSYLVSIGSAEARKSGFVTENGTPLELEKIIDEKNQQITIRVVRYDKENDPS